MGEGGGPVIVLAIGFLKFGGTGEEEEGEGGRGGGGKEEGMEGGGDGETRGSERGSSI